jgi:hypothetical protein
LNNTIKFRIIFCLVGLAANLWAAGAPDRLEDPEYRVRLSIESPENFPLSPKDIEGLKARLFIPFSIKVNPVAWEVIKIRIAPPEVAVVSKLAANLVRLQFRAEILLLKQDNRGMRQVYRVPMTGRALEEGVQNAFRAALKSIKFKEEDMKGLVENLEKYSQNEEI